MRIRLLFPALLALCAAAPAPEQPLLTGREAFGDWHANAPGVRRLIRPQDMPPPFATPSDSNAPGIVPRPAGAHPEAPPGFAATLWASGLSMPRAIRAAPDGQVFVAESGAGRIRVFRPGPDGAAGKGEAFARGLDQPFGIAFWPADPKAEEHFVYVGETGRVLRYPWKPGESHPSGPAQVIVPQIPEGYHWTRDLAFSPDGMRLFVSVGSGSNVARDIPSTPPGGLARWEATHAPGAAWGEETRRADVLSFDPQGGHEAVFATGLRNCSGLIIQPETGALWCAVNERDGLGDNLVPDYATRVTQGAFYGWPWYYIGAHEDPRLHGARPDLAGRITVPDVLIQAHSAPLGIAFYTGSLFPPEYRGDAFVALHGSWNRSRRTGYKLVRLRMRNGAPTGEVDDFLTGFVAGNDAVWARPVDVAVAPDGSLLMTEDGNNTIWRIAPTGR